MVVDLRFLWYWKWRGGGVTYRMPGHSNNNILIENTITNGPVV